MGDTEDGLRDEYIFFNLKFYKMYQSYDCILAYPKHKKYVLFLTKGIEILPQTQIFLITIPDGVNLLYLQLSSFIQSVWPIFNSSVFNWKNQEL